MTKEAEPLQHNRTEAIALIERVRAKCVHIFGSVSKKTCEVSVNNPPPAPLLKQFNLSYNH